MTFLQNSDSSLPNAEPSSSVPLSSFLSIIENSSDIIIRFDPGLRCLYINKSIRRYLPEAPADYHGKSLRECGWPEPWVQTLEHLLSQVIQQRIPREVEWIVDDAESPCIFETRLLPETGENNTLASIVCVARDVTEAWRTRRLLTEENALLEMIADSRPIDRVLHKISEMIESQLSEGVCSIMRLDASGQRLSLAAAPSLPTSYCRLIDGLTIGPETGACGAAAYWKRSIIVEDVAISPLWDCFADSPMRHGLKACWSTPIFDSDQVLLGTMTLYYPSPRSPAPDELRLIYRCSHIAAIALQRYGHEAKLYRLATEDGLTHLFNRRHFLESAERHLSQARRYRHPVSVMMLDLDHFKQINDYYGHAVGDEVLKAFARICQRCLRASDIIGRMGGEEFAAMLPGSSLAVVQQIAERLRQQVEDETLTDGGLKVSFRVSIGIAVWKEGESMEDLLVRADKGLYLAKRQGRNRICFDPEQQKQLDTPAETTRSRTEFNAVFAGQIPQC